MVLTRHLIARVGILSTCVALCLGLAGCADKATEVECDQAYDHLIEVRTGLESAEIVKKINASKLEKNRPVFLKECVGQTSKEVIKCWNTARTTQEMRQCEGAR